MQTITICKYVLEKWDVILQNISWIIEQRVVFILQHSCPEVKWVDGGKPLFKVSTHLVSTVYTQVSFCFWLTVSAVILLSYLHPVASEFALLLIAALFLYF